MTPQEQQWVLGKLSAGDYGAILKEANARGMTADDLAQIVPFSAQQINAYANSPTGQAAIYGQPAQAAPAAPTASYTPPSFDEWMASPAAQKAMDEGGILYAQQVYQDDVASGRWGTAGPTDNLAGERFAPVTINGGQWARMGMDFAGASADPLHAQYLQKAGITADDFYKDPTYGWVTPYDKFHTGVELPISEIKKTDNGFWKNIGMIAAAMSGANVFNSFFPGLAEGGFQSFLSSLAENAASQGGSFADIMREFGLEGIDAPWGANERLGLSPPESDADVFGPSDTQYPGINPYAPPVGLPTATPPAKPPGWDSLPSFPGVDQPFNPGWSFPAGLPPAIPPIKPPGFDDAPPFPGVNQPFPGTTGTPNWLQQFLPSVNGPGSLLSSLLPAGIGALGANAQANAMERMQDKYLGLGAPYRDLLQKSYQPGFSMTNEPGYKDALDMSSQSVLRKLSAGAGNPYDQPNSMTSALDYVTKATAFPALQNYRGQLGQFGQLGVSQAAPFGQGQAQASSGIYDALGFGLNNALNPPTDFSKMLKNFGLNFSGSQF